MAMDESMAIVRINPAFLPLLEKNKKGSIDKHVNLSLAMYLFTDKKVTLSRAAELSKKSTSDFIQILIDHNINWAEYTNDLKKQDADTIDYILKEVEKND